MTQLEAARKGITPQMEEAAELEGLNCTMCGKFCAYKIISEYLGTDFTGC